LGFILFKTSVKTHRPESDRSPQLEKNFKDYTAAATIKRLGKKTI
jgi:hypothetical protein